MPDPFETVRGKIRWAKEHIHTGNILSKAFIDTDFYRYRVHQDRKGRLCIKIQDVDEPPPDLGLFLGSAAHNLRSALDHIMWLFASPTPKQEDKVMFPITSSSVKFTESLYRMPGVKTRARTLTERLQPYHRRKWPETRLLGIIQTLDNWDKHRTLTTSAVTVEDSDVILTPVGARIESVELFRRPLEPNAMVARYAFADAVVGAKVNMKTKLALQPIFDDRMPKSVRRLPAIAYLDAARRFVEYDVLPRYESLFPRWGRRL
jgi:hypothetical protein